MNNIDYTPIPLYDKVKWDLTSEACHVLLISPSGGGKTTLLSYMAAMVLKRGHRLVLIDNKNTSFGALFKSIGVPVATSPEETIDLLKRCVFDMEDTYKSYFSSENISLDTNFSKLNLQATVLIWDEVLAGLECGSKEQKRSMIQLLQQLALKSRMSGQGLLVLTSQKLLATDLPLSISSQCQTRLLLGANISDELFHTTLGSYKKELASSYVGGVGKGYAMTPKTGLTAFEAPYMDFSQVNFKQLLKKLKAGTK
ncbi:cell division protein FtsK [Lactococcus formosensis]|uniref:Cell division protein FtsK n=1 Tax=Lactococcus formosensis TaxID=1281486 RepID=A0A9X4PAK1_9LACT|nr:cell division protein FtsK [Lactococcus formosensis]MDG6143574.1 cell division protein FtsK [Lactococcus formosensis]MDG6156754.1 cell division protein FtsK [Lactococcus formosensis]MDG6167179.1 cell division protein FtsK [Lactococcus formosensis]MDG6173447.1 cell division protein FtsK [Lactococcus formosensis]MDG6194215.1 cell division protein FtsK [Lactococcus formosensis]